MLDQSIARSPEFEQANRYQSASEMAAPMRQILAAANAFISRRIATSPAKAAKGLGGTILMGGKPKVTQRR